MKNQAFIGTIFGGPIHKDIYFRVSNKQWEELAKENVNEVRFTYDELFGVHLQIQFSRFSRLAVIIYGKAAVFQKLSSTEKIISRCVIPCLSL